MYAITTKSRIKDRLGITSTSFDTLLDNLILATTDRIERMCNRRFQLTTYTNELYDGCDPAYATQRKSLIVKNAPITALTSLQYKTGLKSNPTWVDITEDEYDADLEAGILYFQGLPTGRRNIRLSYTAGYNGFSIGITGSWVFNASPTGTVDGSNLTFTLPTTASEIIVYADGMRIKQSNYSFTANTNTFTFVAGQAPFSTISVDYLPSAGADTSDYTLPSEIVEVCEEIVIRLFKRRDSEGRSSETFNESTVTWQKDVFTPENLATVKNYRRASFL